MEKQEKATNEYYTIDLIHILKTLWRRIWYIGISGLLAAILGFSLATFVIAPTYSSSIMLYVNNASLSLGNTSFSISSSEITAAQSLVKTYREILDNRTTLERVIDRAGLDCTYEDLRNMLKAEPSNETEIMKVTVTAKNPYEAANIANCIAEVLPVRISEIIDGASMEVVDSAVPVFKKVAPGITKYTAIGMILGLVLSSAFVVILALLDDTIHDEDYILTTYDYPILAKVPNLLTSSTKAYAYYQKSSRSAKK